MHQVDILGYRIRSLLNLVIRIEGKVIPSGLCFNVNRVRGERES